MAVYRGKVHSEQVTARHSLNQVVHNPASASCLAAPPWLYLSTGSGVLSLNLSCKHSAGQSTVGLSATHTCLGGSCITPADGLLQALTSAPLPSWLFITPLSSPSWISGFNALMAIQRTLVWFFLHRRWGKFQNALHWGFSEKQNWLVWSQRWRN